MSDISQVSSFHDIAGLGKLKGKVQDAQNIREVAEQFESVFVNLALKSARQAMGGDELFGGSQMQMYQEMFDQQISMQVTNSGGIGLADIIERQLRMSQAMSPDTDNG